jgi:uncharacterized protein (TIGR00255 family)
MIQSMTGYGAAHHAEGDVLYALEVRSVNNRYFKLTIKLPEHLQFLESDLERLLRGRLVRGSVTYTLRVRSDQGSVLRRVNASAVRDYVDQLSRVTVSGGASAMIDLATIALLPGVCDVPELDEEARTRERQVVTALTDRALDALTAMRRDEGKALQGVLLTCCDSIRALLTECATRAPGVIDEYHERLKSRVATLTKSGGLELEAEGLMREVAVFAERCDVSEEIARLTSHLDQSTSLCAREEPVGRTLDFLSQELLREANTIASKSNDAAISRCVVEIKGWIDRLKEQVQNVL